jgi:GTPase SAR1 family protein
VNYEKCRENLENLVSWTKQVEVENRNEATTRFHLIDTIILDCLDWHKEDIKTEEAFEGEYTDYTLSLVRPVVIIEAKREGNYFELPEGMKGLEYSIDSLCKDNPIFKKAIQQVCGYCQERGVEIAVVSNGWQYVAFVAVRLDGIPPLKGNAIVFSSLEKIQSHFLEFWNFLSRHGIENKRLKNQLCGITLPNLPQKLSASIRNYPGIKNRNAFQTNLQILSDLILEDVIRYQDLEKIFLEECYCNAGALSHYSAVSKEILKTRYENLFEEDNQQVVVQSAVGKSGINQEFKDIAAHSISRRPILLIGDVGVGKSTFINNLILIEAPEIFNDCISLKIDLGVKIILNIDIREAVISEITKILLTEYQIDIFENNFVRGVYHSDYERFKKGVHKPYFDNNSEKAIEKTIEFFEEKQSNKGEHLKNSLSHIAKARKKQIVIFIDNCDQRDYDTQQTAFLISQEIAENWQPVTIFISLRPETFNNSLKKGALSGYHPKAFTIAPPRVDSVIEKRLEFARKITNGEIMLAQFEGKIGVNLSNLKGLIEVLIYSFRNNSDLHRFIDNICNGNIRHAIDIVKNFLGSGHVDTEKILSIYEETGSYLIPLHEFLRAVIYGNNVHFDPDSSYLFNLFDIHFQDTKEHFLLPILLSILEAKNNSGKDNGFVETIKVSNHLQSIGFSIDQIDNAVEILINKNIIETSARGTTFDRNKLPLSLRITTTGAYHLNVLTAFFTYIDAIIVDTPIFDDQIRNEVQDYNDIDRRLRRAFVFKTYLDSIWKEFEVQQTFFNWSEKSKYLEEDINKIKNRKIRY